MITLSTNYDADGLATTQLELTGDQLAALQSALNGNAVSALFVFPSGKDATNIVSFTLSVDVNGNGNLQVITT